MKFAIAGFKGNTNSSKLLLDQIKLDIKKVYLSNDKKKSVDELIEVLDNVDFIIVFGQKPILKDKICIELSATIDYHVMSTKYRIKTIKEYCEGKYAFKESNNGGTSYCNNVYYYSLNHIKEKNLNSQIVFIHIPMSKNITNFPWLVDVMEGYIKSIIAF